MTYIQARAIVDLFGAFIQCDSERERKCGTIKLSYDFITGEKGEITIPCWDGKLKKGTDNE